MLFMTGIIKLLFNFAFNNHFNILSKFCRKHKP